MPSEPKVTESGFRVETPQYTWRFDRFRHRFCRVPRGRDPGDPSVEAEWAPYCSLWRGADGALTVLLDAAGTLRLRVLR